MEQDRYFIVFYIGSIPNGQVTGYMEFTTYDGSYLNKTMTLKQLNNSNLDLKQIVITNILELNEADFKQWSFKD